MAHRKKYSQTHEDRLHEREGMMEHRVHHSAHSKGHHGFVEGHDPMIGRHDTAGMPRETVMETYPRARHYRGGPMDDSMSGIDAVIDHAENQEGRYLSHQK